MTDITALNTAAVGDKIVRTESGAFIVLAGVQSTLDLTVAANAGVALLKPHAKIWVKTTSPQVLYTSFLPHAPSLESAAEQQNGNVNGVASWGFVATTASASTVADILSGLATFEKSFEGHAS
jgi:hypothetical protein